MNRKTLWTWILAILVGLVFVWFVPASGQDQQDQDDIVLVGVIVAVDWDENGDVVAVDLQTEEDWSIAVDISQNSLQLLSLVDEQVEIVGSLFDGDDGWTYIEVRSFTVIPSRT